MKTHCGEELPTQIIPKLLTSFKFGKLNFYSGNLNSFCLSLSFPFPYLDKTKIFYDNEENNNSSFSNEHHFVTLQNNYNNDLKPTPSLKKFSCFVLFNLFDI